MQATVIVASDGGGCFDFDCTAASGDLMTQKSRRPVLRFRVGADAMDRR